MCHNRSTRCFYHPTKRHNEEDMTMFLAHSTQIRMWKTAHQDISNSVTYILDPSLHGYEPNDGDG